MRHDPQVNPGGVLKMQDRKMKNLGYYAGNVVNVVHTVTVRVRFWSLKSILVFSAWTVSTYTVRYWQDEQWRIVLHFCNPTLCNLVHQIPVLRFQSSRLAYLDRL